MIRVWCGVCGHVTPWRGSEDATDADVKQHYHDAHGIDLDPPTPIEELAGSEPPC